MLSWSEIESRAVAFQAGWKNCDGNEKQEASTFIRDLLNVFDIDSKEGVFEYPIRDEMGRIRYIDYLLPGKILIEMKSKGESLIRAYNQAMEYSRILSPEEYPKIVLVSDFAMLQLTNLETGHQYNPFRLSSLRRRLRMFGILAGYSSSTDFETNIELNIKASEKMAQLHDALKQHGYEGHELEIYLVRLLFCLFAEDTGIFESRSFENYLTESKIDGSDLSARLMQLFEILDTPDSKRLPAHREAFRSFRYIDGQLFEEIIPVAYFDSHMRQTLIDCCNFDWSTISPAIFGAMFQGVMDPEIRRELGAYYTSEENILKVLRPLFLDGLRDEFEVSKRTLRELNIFHEKLGNITLLDPACGCGNFLLVAYRELRLIEFELLQIIDTKENVQMLNTLTRIHLNHFYGIEHEEFPVQVARVSLILMKHQMDQLVSNYFRFNTVDFPIKESAQIYHGNALRMNWAEIIEPAELNYIIGNPPFVGGMNMSERQTEDMRYLMSHIRGFGELDYVCAWYIKAVELIDINPRIRTAFVSTNSIIQGQPVTTFWRYLVEKESVEIQFAYQTFPWSNEARGRAAVHCVIIGFGRNLSEKKILFDSDGRGQLVNHINPYLTDSPTVFIESRSVPICNVTQMRFGSMPRDGGFLIMTDEERAETIAICPDSLGWIRPYIGAKEFINRNHRWVLWLVGVSLSELRQCPPVADRIRQVKAFRSRPEAPAGTRKYAATPALFCQIAQPEEGHYIVVPGVSSELREYVPVGFMTSYTIASNLVFLIPDATLYEFGIITSAAHMAWMRLVAGRLKSDYRYSKNLVYNTFPWPRELEQSQVKIEKTAQAILDAREVDKNATYADLYDPDFMPEELRRAHKANDQAVMEAYGAYWETDAECVSFLLERYQQLTKAEISGV